MFFESQEGVTLNTYNEKTSECSLFIPKKVFSEYEIYQNGSSSGFCINFGLLLDFLHLSLTRGSRPVTLTSWFDRDYVELK